jgi:hypothetical protein
MLRTGLCEHVTGGFRAVHVDQYSKVLSHNYNLKCKWTFSTEPAYRNDTKLIEFTFPEVYNMQGVSEMHDVTTGECSMHKTSLCKHASLEVSSFEFLFVLRGEG